MQSMQSCRAEQDQCAQPQAKSGPGKKRKSVDYKQALTVAQLDLSEIGFSPLLCAEEALYFARLA